MSRTVGDILKNNVTKTKAQLRGLEEIYNGMAKYFRSQRKKLDEMIK